MKPEELFFSLDQVGEDLIGAAEQNILVRKRRPWLGAAAAALLIAAVGAGGFFLWRQLGRSGPIEAAGPSASVESSGVSRPEPDRALPMLEVAGNCPERDRRLVADLSGLPETDLTGIGRLNSLPVYRRAARTRPFKRRKRFWPSPGRPWNAWASGRILNSQGRKPGKAGSAA